MGPSPTPPLLLTAGEPAGIGPDLCVMLAQRPRPAVVVCADPLLLEARAGQLGLPLKTFRYRPGEHVQGEAGRLSVYPVALKAGCQPGRLNPDNANYVLETLRLAVQGCQCGDFAGMVTGPLHKGVINDAGHPFTGHTEFLAGLTGAEQVVMMLATEGLRVALATTHLPLREVSAAITPARLKRVITTLHHDLQQRFGINDPTILVCGLNPHAGEGGHLGREEIEVITPTLEPLRAAGMRLIGPLPADTLFTPPYLQQADAVLAMYHDQGLPVLKYRGFGNAVNVTLGLPIIRTSVDHGTALDLAGSGNATLGSLLYAIEVATQMTAPKGPPE